MSIENNIDGLKYFIYLISQNGILPYIDIDIRKKIWDHACNPYLLININNIIMRLNIII